MVSNQQIIEDVLLSPIPPGATNSIKGTNNYITFDVKEFYQEAAKAEIRRLKGTPIKKTLAVLTPYSNFAVKCEICGLTCGFLPKQYAQQYIATYGNNPLAFNASVTEHQISIDIPNIEQ